MKYFLVAATTLCLALTAKASLSQQEGVIVLKQTSVLPDEMTAQFVNEVKNNKIKSEDFQVNFSCKKMTIGKSSQPVCVARFIKPSL